MTPIPFREQNITYNPPEGMEDKCDALPAFRGEGQVISSGWAWIARSFVNNPTARPVFLP